MVETEKMDQNDQGDNSSRYVSADLLVKRRRGRPRKYPRPDPKNPNFGGPPGYERANRNQTRHRGPTNDSNDVVVGQPVNGVIEAAFDAGYLLSVKVGNSETMLRGVVFKPGHYAPVSADNDVAPNVPMIRRNTVRVSGKSHRGRSRGYGASWAKDRQLVPVSAQPIIPRGYLVPVVLPPANLQNKGHFSKQVPEPSLSSNGSLPTNPGENRVIHAAQSQSMPNILPGVTQGEMGHSKPFETLLSEVMKRGQVEAPSPSVEAESDDQALSIEPLQAIHPVQTVSIQKPIPTYGTGKMTELLQAVQENMRETHASRANDIGVK